MGGLLNSSYLSASSEAYFSSFSSWGYSGTAVLRTSRVAGSSPTAPPTSPPYSVSVTRRRQRAPATPINSTRPRNARRAQRARAAATVFPRIMWMW